MTLNSLLKLDLSKDELLAIGEKVGDDVKFFISGYDTAYMDGSHLSSFSLRDKISILLIKPDFNIDTTTVYSYFRQHYPTTSLSKVIGSPDIIPHHIYKGKNDLYDAVTKIHPRIVDVIELLEKQPGNISARMSGSGSTCFGIFKSDDCVKKAATNIKTMRKKFFLHSFTINP